MRLYLTQLTGTGSTDDPYRSVLSGRGYKVRRIADFRTNRAQADGWALWLCRTDAAQHAEAIALPGVIYVPIENASGEPVGPSATLADVDADKRTQMAAFLRARNIPTKGIRLNMPVRQVVSRLVRAGQLSGWLRSDSITENLDLLVRDIPAARRNALRNRLEALGFVVSTTQTTTVEDLIESLIAQRDDLFPRVDDSLLT